MTGHTAKFIRGRRMLPALILFAIAAGIDPADAACQLLQVGELPVTMVGNSPVIPVSINGHAVQLLLDTGSARSLIWRSAAQTVDLKMVQSDMKFYGVGGADSAGVVTVHDFGIAGATIHDVHLFAAGRGAAPADTVGILGEDVLSHWDIELDLSGGKVRLFAPKNCTGDQVVYWAQSYFMTGLLNGPEASNYLEARVLLNGREVVALFDSGASVSAVTPQALRRADIQAETPLAAAGMSHGLSNTAISTAVAIFPTLTIGQESVKNVKLRVADLFGRNTEVRLGSFIARGVMDDPDLLVGADFFLAHRIYVARSQRKIYFTYKGGPVFQRVGNDTLAPPGKAESPDEASSGADDGSVSHGEAPNR